MDIYRQPSIFETYNARHLSAQQVAETFVPPTGIFSKLSTNNNHIIVGPRGSGKTTLLKMLTLPALLNWNSSTSEEVSQKVGFIGIFIPADRGWTSQVSSNLTGSEIASNEIGKIAFTTHVLNSLVRTIENFTLFKDGNSDAFVQSLEPLTANNERSFVELIAEAWRLDVKIKEVAGLRLALRSRLIHLHSAIPKISRSDDPKSALFSEIAYADLNYRESLKYAIEAYHAITQSNQMQWALLFDEFEIAPQSIQHDVISHLRGESTGYLLSKIALAPFNQNFMTAIKASDSSPRNDYEVIDLCYPLKSGAYDFSEKLFRKNLTVRGMPLETPIDVLGRSDFTFDEENDPHPYSSDGEIFKAYENLKRSDQSFADYLESQRVNIGKWNNLSEDERAPIRKFRSVVITREYFRSKARSAESKSNQSRASRKIETIYAGAPTLLSLCEGNPRILIGLLAPIFDELSIIRGRSRKEKVEKNFQARQIRLSVNAFRALIKTVVQEKGDAQPTIGLLKFLDQIGDYFHRKCVIEPFSPQPHLSFTVPSNADRPLLELVERALNLGAIIYLPDKDADPILNSLQGKRFRLSYLLAAYYRIPIMLNQKVSVDRILKEYGKKQQSMSSNFGQVDLFENNDGPA